MSFVRVNNRSNNCKAYTSAASTAYSIGMVLSLNASTGALQLASSNDVIAGICLQAKLSSDTSTSPLLVDLAHQDDIFEADCSGTMANSYLADTCDIAAGSLTVALATDTNHDFRIVDWDGVTTGKTRGHFTKTLFV